MFDIYRVNEKKDVTHPKIVRIKKQMITKKELLDCKVELLYSSGLSSNNEIIFLAKILEGKRINQIIPINEKDIC